MECYPSKVKLLGLLGLTCALVGVSYFCTTLPGLIPQVVGWLGVGFFGLGFLALERAAVTACAGRGRQVVH